MDYRRTLHKENFKKFKVIFAIVTALAVLGVSIILSKQGIGFTGSQEWMGYAIALALTCAQLIFTDQYEEISWTLLVLGVGAYIYSIGTNISGIYMYKGLEGTLWTNFNLEALLLGMLVDIYPEAAIAWALGAGKVGDFLGNIFNVINDPGALAPTTAVTNSQARRDVPQSIPRVSNTPHPVYSGPVTTQSNRNERPNPRPRPATMSNMDAVMREIEPTYHPVSYREMNENQ